MVDTIGLSIPLEPAEWSAIAPLYSRTIREDKVKRGVVRSWLDRRNRRVKLEFSAPIILNGHNVQTLDATQTMEVIVAAIRAICANLEIAPRHPCEAKITRLDLCNDLVVEDPAGYVWRMAMQYRSTLSNPKKILFGQDENGYRSLTLYVQRQSQDASARLRRGSSPRAIRCYDKGGEVACTYGGSSRLIREATGIVRREVSLYASHLGPALRKVGGNNAGNLGLFLNSYAEAYLAKRLTLLMCSGQAVPVRDQIDALIAQGHSPATTLREIGLLHATDQLGFDEVIRQLGVTSRQTSYNLHKMLLSALGAIQNVSSHGSP